MALLAILAILAILAVSGHFQSCLLASFSHGKMLLHAFRRNCRRATQKMTRYTAEALQGKEKEREREME